MFNPSNIGLVVAFLVLGSTQVEPLDFWWSPLDGPMILAYAVILIGGVLITRRLHLLAAAATFWVGLAAGVGLVAASGHCMVARWAFAPVCGFDFWWVIVTSPEVLIFLFFMLTDPKTVPLGRVGPDRVRARASRLSQTLLSRPQTNEFGTKVALLGSLVIVCAARPFLERLLPAAGSATTIRSSSRGGSPAEGRRPPLARAGALLGAVALAGVAIVAAGDPARGFVDPPTEDVLGRLPREIDPATLPSIAVAQDVVDWNHEITGEGAQEIVLALAENLELEHQALRRAPTPPSSTRSTTATDSTSCASASRTRRRGTTVAEQYPIDDVHITLVVPFGRQDGPEPRPRVPRDRHHRDLRQRRALAPRPSAPFATSVRHRPPDRRSLAERRRPARERRCDTATAQDRR